MSLISRIHSDSADFLTKRLAAKGLPNFATSHGFILFQLAQYGTLTMSELAHRVNRDKSTLTVLIRKLSDEGFVHISDSPHDHRSRIITLTQKGHAYTDITSELSRELAATFFSGFSNQEQHHFCQFLERIHRNFAAAEITERG